MIDLHFLGWELIEISTVTKFQWCTLVKNGQIWPKKGSEKPKTEYAGVLLQMCTMSILMSIFVLVQNWTPRTIVYRIRFGPKSDLGSTSIKYMPYGH